MRKRFSAAPQAPAPPAPRNLDLILYVEDEASNRQVMQLWLGTSFELLVATNDAEACELVRHHHQQLSCILMDIQLQGSALSGIELTRLMRGKALNRPIPNYAQLLPFLDIPIIFLTAYGENYSNAELEEAGGSRIFSKPVNFSQLNLVLAQASVRKALGKFVRS